MEVVSLGHEKNMVRDGPNAGGSAAPDNTQGFEEASDGLCFILFKVPPRRAQLSCHLLGNLHAMRAKWSKCEGWGRKEERQGRGPGEL